MFYKHDGTIESESSSESEDNESTEFMSEMCGPEFYRDEICEDVGTDIFLKRIISIVQCSKLIQETPCNYKGSKLLNEETSQLIKKNVDSIISKVIDEVPNFDFGRRNATMRLAYGFVNVI